MTELTRSECVEILQAEVGHLAAITSLFECIPGDVVPGLMFESLASNWLDENLSVLSVLETSLARYDSVGPLRPCEDLCWR